MFCDLHMHSTASDGTDPPESLPQLARAAGLAAIALTDHDTSAGIAACRAACEEEGLAFIAGIELSASPKDVPGKREDGKTGTLHILGYGIDPDADSLLVIEKQLLEAREQRNPQIVANLHELGVKLDYNEVVAKAEAAGAKMVGRPHIAQALVERGYVRTIHEAFSKYIGEGAAAYARKDRLSAENAIAAIHTAGGLAVLAHPVQLRRASAKDLEATIVHLKRFGLDGMEVHHSDHGRADVKQYQQLAEKLNLIPTGGSDYHGQRKNIPLNNCRVPYAVFQKLKQCIDG